MTVNTNDSGNQGNNAGSTGENSNTASANGASTNGAATGGEGASGNQNDDTLDESTLDEKTKAYLKKMRAENAKHRTRANKLEAEFEGVKTRLKGLVGGDDTDNVPPEKKIEELASSVNSFAMENAILTIAVQNNIGADSLDYFKFLVSKRAGELAEGEELTDEDLKPILDEVRSKQKSTQTSTSVSANQSNTNPNAGSEVTLEQFAKMGIIEKSTLYRKNPSLYESLMAQARIKKLIR